MTKVVDENYKIGSEILTKIEGKAVFDLLNELNFVSKELSEFIVSFAYGQVFPLPHLDLKTKELLILAMLLAKENAEPQLKVHLKSALNTGNSFNEIQDLITIFSNLNNIDKPLSFIDFIEEQKHLVPFETKNLDELLMTRNRYLIEIAILSTLGNQTDSLISKIKEALKFGITQEEINEVMLLLIPYCGFPNAINGTLILKQTLQEMSIENR